MSGGAYNYTYHKVLEFADAIRGGYDFDERQHEPSQDRREFAEHLYLIAEAMRAIEWTDSGDSSVDAEITAIKRCLDKRSSTNQQEQEQEPVCREFFVDTW